MNKNTPVIPRSVSLLIGLAVHLVTVTIRGAEVPVFKEVVVPGSLADVEGNSRLTDPFSFGGAGVGAVRMQQVYAASEFTSGVAQEGGWIYGLSFRSDEGSVPGVYSADIPNLQVRLSVTDRGADQLSPVFSENFGSSVALVNSGRTFVQVVADQHTSPDSWRSFFTFSVPYYYDPWLGNLLLDVINIGGPPFTGLDAVDVEGDGVSRVYYRDFGTQIPPLGTTDTKGLVTAFNIMPVPEPSTWALMAVGAAILAWRYCHSNSRRKLNHVAH